MPTVPKLGSDKEKEIKIKVNFGGKCIYYYRLFDFNLNHKN